MAIIFWDVPIFTQTHLLFSSFIYTLWLFNIAMENGPFIDDLPIKMVIFHGYVKQPEGIYLYLYDIFNQP